MSSKSQGARDWPKWLDSFIPLSRFPARPADYFSCPQAVGGVLGLSERPSTWSSQGLLSCWRPWVRGLPAGRLQLHPLVQAGTSRAEIEDGIGHLVTALLPGRLDPLFVSRNLNASEPALETERGFFLGVYRCHPFSSIVPGQSFLSGQGHTADRSLASLRRGPCCWRSK